MGDKIPQGGGSVRILTSRQPPYTRWHWQDIGAPLGGPNVVSLPNRGLWAGGRCYPDRKICLGELRDGVFTRRLSSPSGGDNSYPGFVWQEGLRWMSYYSSHEGRASIYLAKIRMDH